MFRSRPVEDPVELDSLMRIFSEMLTDTDFEM